MFAKREIKSALGRSIAAWKLVLRARGIDTGTVRAPLALLDKKLEKRILNGIEEIDIL